MFLFNQNEYRIVHCNYERSLKNRNKHVSHVNPDMHKYVVKVISVIESCCEYRIKYSSREGKQKKRSNSKTSSIGIQFIRYNDHISDLSKKKKRSHNMENEQDRLEKHKKRITFRYFLREESSFR